MRAVLPGRPESTRQALSTANWDGLRLVAYVSGKIVVIFNGRREILQSITIDEVDVLQGVSIEETSGRLAAYSQDCVYTYEPLGREYGDIRWTLLHQLELPSATKVNHLSWGLADELLVGGSALHLWSFADNTHPAIIWSSELASPVILSVFANDAGIIATCGQHDKLVKIWRRLSYEVDGTRFDVSYLPHPAAVTNLQWRKPWHSEQNLDDLLYTSCSDSYIRVWAYSDPHGTSLMQEVARVDLNASIQPRRLSVGSVSTKRFAFILDSRDISRAAEKAVQLSRQGTDHALEHLIEIANRSPEICVVLDGLGHMSAWGLENAGYKNKRPTERFNIAHVDGVDISLPLNANAVDHYAQICAFANNDANASLCILVHSYTGQIDWYQGSIVGFFDTARRGSRTQLSSSWSGHSSAIERIVSAPEGTRFMSWTVDNDAIVWSLSPSGALVRAHELDADLAIIDVLLFENCGHLLLLHSTALSLWKLGSTGGEKVFVTDIDTDDGVAPKALWLLGNPTQNEAIDVAILFTDGQSEHWQVSISVRNGSHQTNGARSILSYISSMADNVFTKFEHVFVPQNVLRSELVDSDQSLVAVSSDGMLSGFAHQRDRDDQLRFTERRSAYSTIRNLSGASATVADRCVLYDSLRSTIHIWNNQQSCFELSRTFKDVLAGSYWLSTNDGSLLLALFFTYHIVVLAQQKYNIRSETAPWVEKKSIRMRDHTTLPIQDLCWTHAGDLVITAGNQLFVIDVMSQKQEKPANGHMQTKSLNRLINSLRVQNSELGLFHPSLIHNLVLGQDRSLLTTISTALDNELRYLVTDEHLNSDLGLSLESTTNISEGDEKSTHELKLEPEDTLKSTTQHIDKVPDEQLNSDEKNRLRVLLTSHVKLTAHAVSLDSFAQQYFYLLSTTPAGSSLSWSSYVFATLSSTQEALLDLTLRFAESQHEENGSTFKLTWSNARRLGLFLWIRDLTTLRDLFEQVARAEYNKNPDDRNPVDCSLYYLALDKKTVLLSLWRTTLGIKEKENTMKLLGRDFSEERWRATALKNAFALLSRRRFEYAAAWFLLGGSLSDAVNVCANQVGDIQLAIAIVRVWEGDVQLQEEVLRDLKETMLSRFAPESVEVRWIALWGCVTDADWRQAIKYIALPIDRALRNELESWRKEREDSDQPPRCLSWQVNEPTLLLQLFKHVRDQLVKAKDWTKDVASEQDEWDFLMRCVRYYTRSGMSLLAARLVRHWQFVPRQTQREQTDSVALSEGLTEAKDQAPSKAEQQVGSSQAQKKPPPTQFVEPSADSLLDSFGF